MFNTQQNIRCLMYFPYSGLRAHSHIAFAFALKQETLHWTQMANVSNG